MKIKIKQNKYLHLEKDREIFLILCICRTCKGKSVNLIASVDEAMIIHLHDLISFLK